MAQAPIPPLLFNEELLHPNDLGNILLRFREQGFAKIGGVFKDESVDAYREGIRSRVVETGDWWNPLRVADDDPMTLAPARSPRLLQVLRGAFMAWIAPPQPVLMNCGWLVRPDNPDAKLVHDWHKDGDHNGATTVLGYTYPQVIHTAAYFTDMTPEHGPTYVIPRSHRDPQLSPYDGAAEAPFLMGKADVIIWDQRLWHRASPRTAPGLRLLNICTFYPVPVHQGQLTRSPAHQAALEQATTDVERVLFGGPFKG